MLPNFTRALERNKSSIDYHQFWRYTKAGRLPKLLIWLVERPDLAQALAADAAELAKGRDTPIVAAEDTKGGAI